MHKFLISWYGITDLRAALGLETETGPVLGALLAEDYTDVIILAYTRPEKNGDGESFEQKREKITSVGEGLNSLVESMANTPEAHELFKGWLLERLTREEKSTNVHLHPIFLDHLNDSEGIYQAVLKVLELVSELDEDVPCTLFLSPGTPVMAFSWAFASLQFPGLSIRLLASSRTGRPPEEILLPRDWLDWYGRRNESAPLPQKWDAVFHLFGEQRLPSLLGVMQFPSHRHIFVNSPAFPATTMRQFMDGAEFEELPVDPFSAGHVRKTLIQRMATLPEGSRIAFNLTGGTKLMYAGALEACRHQQASPFYFNSRAQEVIDLNSFHSWPTIEITSVDDFFKLNGTGLFISNRGDDNTVHELKGTVRNELTRALWHERSSLANLYSRIIPHVQDSSPFHASYGNIEVSLSPLKQARVIVQGKRYDFKYWPAFGRYITGGWFEEYVYSLLYPFMEKQQIKDLRIGLTVSCQAETNTIFSPLKSLYQEFDLVFTNGRQLFIIECKAGQIKSEHIEKLQNIVARFGGVEGQGILASCFDIDNSVIRKRSKDARNIHLATGKHLQEQILALIHKEKVRA
ncbi:Card1-like endonuclease domain-containing protein [Mailhella sp.]